MKVVETVKSGIQHVLSRMRGSSLSVEDLQHLGEAGWKLSERVRALFPSEPGPPVQQMTYEMALGFFVTDRPSDPRIVKGAMWLEARGSSWLLTQFFLDRGNQLVCDPGHRPYGRWVQIAALDDELRRAFGGRNLIIVE